MKMKPMMSRFVLTSSLVTIGSVVMACLTSALLGPDDTSRVITWPAITLSLLLGGGFVLHLYRHVRAPTSGSSIRLLVLALCFTITTTVASFNLFATVTDPYVSTPAISDAQLDASTR